ncbi:HD domain-containing protein [Roseibium sp. RKSG952]|uniref:HD domain-containing protein n=1 Tax=Roseibium sp. RKSG952 TaxID=2529384 RepID=UPI0012BC8B1F|nr:HD domain-containing protein [Roseibium sp. RKSG952]MTH95268.1 HD domain-containing protein [Roseibium sp. RKSG952]
MSNLILKRDPTSVPGHPSLEETAAFADTLHAGQTDKAGEPYIGHLIRVSRHLVQLFPHATPVERHAAWLHDALEDTPVTAAELRGRGYAPEVIEIVEAVTKDPDNGETYAERIETLAARGPRGALRVKIADLTDNVDTARLATLSEAKAASLGKRYTQARERLLAALDAPLGALASDDDPNEFPMPLLLQLPAVEH